MPMKHRTSPALALAMLAMTSGSAVAAPFLMTNGTGDGTLSVGVDGFGAFGSSAGNDTSNAIYDPIGAIGAAGTTFESAVAVDFGQGGSFLASGGIGASGNLANPTITGDATSATSSFLFGGLSFELTQTLVTLTSGARLDQVYSITNVTDGALAFDLIRYIDGDLRFDGSIQDGGGRLLSGGQEILFETDSATGSADSTTFIGITGEGGTVPVSGRYEADSFSGLRSRIIGGVGLDDLITNDGADADQFVDAGQGYDITLALRNAFLLGAGGSATYSTSTIFGTGAPDEVVRPDNPVPEPAALSLLGLGLVGVGAARRRKKLG